MIQEGVSKWLEEAIITLLQIVDIKDDWKRLVDACGIKVGPRSLHGPGSNERHNMMVSCFYAAHLNCLQHEYHRARP